MKETIKYVVLIILMWVIIAGIGFYYFSEKSACEARGGALVRGAFGFACVAGAR